MNLKDRAAKSVDTPSKLRRRLMEAKGVLLWEFRKKFSPSNDCRLDFAEKRLYSPDGKLYLQWKNDGQSTRGSVSLHSN